MKKLINGENQIQKLYMIRKKIHNLQEIELNLVKKAIKHIEQYGKLEEQIWTAIIDAIEKRCPKWKEEFIAACGTQDADVVIENTPISICKKVSVLYKGVKVNGGKNGNK